MRKRDRSGEDTKDPEEDDTKDPEEDDTKDPEWEEEDASPEFDPSIFHLYTSTDKDVFHQGFMFAAGENELSAKFQAVNEDTMQLNVDMELDGWPL